MENLTEEYDTIIILEDDLVVSPYFYKYAIKSNQFFSDDHCIGGVSLYAYDFNEFAQLPFYPLEDGYDNYFMQIASSWGQMWNRNQWRLFKDWYELNKDKDIKESDLVPINITLWPRSSWKKYFIKYLVQEGKYFVFPRISLTTNFSDPGMHQKAEKDRNYQVSMLYGEKKYNFSDFQTSSAVYDSFYEILPSKIKKYISSQEISDDFSMDLYGLKNKVFIFSEYVFTVKGVASSIRKYSLETLPLETNIFNTHSGNELISFCRTSDLKPGFSALNFALRSIRMTKTFYLKVYLRIIAFLLKKKILKSK